MKPRGQAQDPTPRDGGDDLDEVVTSLLTASRALVGVTARSLALAEETVSLPQFRTLVVLRAHGATRLSDLARRLGVNASTALRSVDRLIAADLVDRRENSEDRREVVIELRPAGRALVDDVTARRRQALQEIVVAIPPAQRSTLVTALQCFAAAADEPQVETDSAALLGW